MRRCGWVLFAAVLGGCGEADPGALRPAPDVPAIAGVGPGVTVAFRDPATRGEATADLADEEGTCSVGSGGVRLDVGEAGPGRDADQVRLRSAPLQRRDGQAGYEAVVRAPSISIGGAGPLAAGASGTLRLAADARSGTARFGDVTVSFTC